MICGAWNPQEIWHQYLVHLPTSHVYCSHFTLGNRKKSFFQQYYSYILQIIYVILEENKLLCSYPPHLKNVTTLPCKMHNFFIWLKVCCIPSNVGGSEKKPIVGWHWWLWKEPVVMCGKWNVRQALQQMFKVTTCTDTCFQSCTPLINCIVHHALVKFSPCRN